MKQYLVEMSGQVTEWYVVFADSEQEAAENWDIGSLCDSEAYDMEVVKATLDYDFDEEDEDESE